MPSIRSSRPFRLQRSPEPRRWLRAHALGAAALAQLCGLACVLIAAPAVVPAGVAIPDAAFGLAQGGIATLLGVRWGLPRWWHGLNLLLPVLGWEVSGRAIDPHWFLAAFAATFLVFGAATLKSGVPLYFSGRSAVAALCEFLPARSAIRFLDAGGGIGTVLAGLSERRPEAIVEGIEAAVAPWFASRLRSALAGGRFRARLGDFWNEDFGRFDIVYAFLSPAPMLRLWGKVKREMRPGSFFISNSFAVPGVIPTLALDLDQGGGRLYVWRM